MLKTFRFLISLMLALGLATTGMAQEPAKAPTIEGPTKAQLDEFNKLIGGGYIIAQDFELFLAEKRPYWVSVVCDLAKAIVAGKYDWMNEDIAPANFPESGCKAGQVGVRLFKFSSSLTTDEVNSNLSKEGYRPATLLELLALGSAYPDLQRKFWIVALGSSCRSPDGHVGFPVLSSNGRERELPLDRDDPGSEWRPGLRFAAVRKQPNDPEPLGPPHS